MSSGQAEDSIVTTRAPAAPPASTAAARRAPGYIGMSFGKPAGRATALFPATATVPSGVRIVTFPPDRSTSTVEPFAATYSRFRQPPSAARRTPAATTARILFLRMLTPL